MHYLLHMKHHEACREDIYHEIEQCPSTDSANLDLKAGNTLKLLQCPAEVSPFRFLGLEILLGYGEAQPE
jgi:hypothetical protein